MLGWATTNGLSEKGLEAKILYMVCIVCLVFPRLRKLSECVCGVGLEGLSPIGVWDVLDGWTHDGHGTM